MYPIVEAKLLAPDVKLFRIHAPRVARKRKAGQFVIIRIDEHGERIPLTIADSDDQGNITIIVQGVGKTTKWLNTLNTGDTILDVVGPLGEESEIGNFGTVVVIGGGVGTAIAYPTAVAMKQAGSRVISIVGARNKELLILEEELQATSDELCIMTDDGSYGEQGFVTQKLQELIDRGETIARVLAIGPIPMMRAVADVTREKGIKTIVSLNPIMVDGTGMCGGCRVQVGGKSKFACVDGPEFDAHDVDFEILIQRNSLYKDQEQKSLEQFESEQCESKKSACRLQHEHPEVGPKIGTQSNA
ncbi:Dihydroorotate dehydrogenase B (NAD(+)), electron transfer subunit [Planctomycetes bacterium CA13]|uniref:Dihydroorotate dehydrogenase B (NAD(+)), electron transfer subunit n=1 Tax=Novipirellula herctigrandis TaxID=2527986 RepID=A0A5C5Z6Q2_9BACT|nr:Dihydroorotate dehydrogenase B (NAD(+)), electron transfer subunit [Planctomycetes bacterium CA13]